MKHRPKEIRLHEIGLRAGRAWLVRGGFIPAAYFERFDEEDRELVKEGFKEGMREIDKALARAS